jgi:hypothetical protein
LDTLLGASGINYIIGSSESDPEKIETVVLMTRVDGPAPSAGGNRPMTPAYRAFQQMKQSARSGAAPSDEPQGPMADSAPPTNGGSPAQPADDPNPNPDQAPGPSQALGPAPLRSNPVQADSAPISNQSNGIQEQITNMEQLFEQRRQMNMKPTPPQN